MAELQLATQRLFIRDFLNLSELDSPAGIDAAMRGIICLVMIEESDFITVQWQWRLGSRPRAFHEVLLSGKSLQS
jgi:hypothetical protein